MVARGCSLHGTSGTGPGDPQGSRHEQRKLYERPQSHAEHRHDRHTVVVGPSSRTQGPPLDRCRRTRTKNGGGRVDVPCSGQAPAELAGRQGTHAVNRRGQAHLSESANSTGGRRLPLRTLRRFDAGRHLQHLPKPVQGETSQNDHRKEHAALFRNCGHLHVRSPLVLGRTSLGLLRTAHSLRAAGLEEPGTP